MPGIAKGIRPGTEDRAGMTQERYYAGMIGITPNIIVSDAYMKETVEHPYVFQGGGLTIRKNTMRR